MTKLMVHDGTLSIHARLSVFDLRRVQTQANQKSDLATALLVS